MRHPSSKRRRPVAILVHGGAGSSRPGRAILNHLKIALEAGYTVLAGGGRSVDAVETAVAALEETGQFNAGLGSRSQMDGRQRMDAAIMEGSSLQAGGVASLEGFVHPVRAARLVMEHTAHALMTGPGAAGLARRFGLKRAPRLSPPERGKEIDAATDHALRAYGTDHGEETVGAVALDERGNLSAASSTGGIGAMLPGRVGDTPLVGAGLYADNDSAAVALTGWGEAILRTALAKEVTCLIRAGVVPAQAARRALIGMMRRVRGKAGCILLLPDGRFTVAHTTPYMPAGYRTASGGAVIRSGFGTIRMRSKGPPPSGRRAKKKSRPGA